MATLIKLLAINIVAKSKFGFFNNLKTCSWWISLSSASISLDPNEKKATSAADIKAEDTSKMNIINDDKRISTLNKDNFISEIIEMNINMGEESKLDKF